MPTRRPRNRIAILLGASLLSNGALAEPPVEPPETSFVTVEDAPPVDPGATEVELTYDYTSAPKAFGSQGGTRSQAETRSHLATLTLTYGFAPRFDVAASAFVASLHDPRARNETTTGFGDTSLTVKWHFFGEGGDGLHFAYLPGVTIPTGREGGRLAPGEGHWSANQMLVSTWVRGRWTLSADASFRLPFGDRDDARGFALVNLGIGPELAGWIKPVFELSYSRDFIHRLRDGERFAAGGGVVFEPAEHWRVDLGFRHDFAGRNSDRSLGVTANVSRTF